MLTSYENSTKNEVLIMSIENLSKQFTDRITILVQCKRVVNFLPFLIFKHNFTL